MGVTLGLNSASLHAQRELGSTEKKLSSVFERLSSGMRINRASDDAAGLAIASSLRADSRVFNQGVRNLNDGISLLNIADSTIEQLENVVIRIQELANQAANGSLSTVQREALDLEAQALSDEFTRIAQSTEFNGTKLFDGSLADGLRLQGGFGVDGGIFSELGGALADGTFGSFTLLGNQASGIKGVDAVSADLDGDGNLDLVYGGLSNVAAGDYQPGFIYVQLGNGDGTFQDMVTYAAPDGGLNDLSLRDLDNDGVLDLVAVGDVDGDNAVISVRLGNGDGSFGDELQTSTGLANLQSLSIADLDSDGILDIAVGNAGVYNAYLGNGDGTFTLSQSTSFGSGSTIVQLGDFNGDGIADLFTSYDSGATTFSISLGNGDGTFGAAQSIGGQDTSTIDVQLADINQDGNLDIIAGGNDGGGASIQVLFGNGDGTFTDIVTNAFGNGTISDIEIRDLNGDGILDVAAGITSGAEEVRISYGTGDGTFSVSVSYAYSVGDVDGLTIGDFDNDGVSDIAVVGDSGGGSPKLRAAFAEGNSISGINPLLDFSLATQADALQALAPLSRSLDALTLQRGVIGAFQSRLTSATNVLSSSVENYDSARSRIEDADIASEVAQLTTLSILQESTAAILAQANQQPALVLTLLRNE